ncbi:MAG: hypothetical protein OQL06_06180 [Gammaproteobacteria bacterium]|nr:hypothetical protein [Gammaproteobacteria bacterium]
MPIKKIFFISCLSCFLSVVLAGKPVVENVKAECDPDRVCKFDVTLRHADAGWSHYANGWEILTPSGEIVGRRVLAHPHVNEQPFTRSLRDVSIPASVDRVIIRAHDSTHGYSERKYVIRLNFGN